MTTSQPSPTPVRAFRLLTFQPRAKPPSALDARLGAIGRRLARLQATQPHQVEWLLCFFDNFLDRRNVAREPLDGGSR